MLLLLMYQKSPTKSIAAGPIIPILIVGFLLSLIPLWAANTATITSQVQISVCGNLVKEGGEQCDNADLNGKACTDLGYDAGTLACSPSCEFDTASCTTPAEASAEPAFVSSIGGSYTLTNGSNSLDVSLSSGFSSDDVRVVMFSFENDYYEDTKPAPSGRSFIGKTYELNAVNDEGEVGITFTLPATVTIEYDDADVMGFTESSLVVYRWGDGDTGWQVISGAVLDTGNNTITLTTTEFSSFALFALPPSSGGDTGGSGGGYVPPQTNSSVALRGYGYRNSTITILKDGQIAATVTAGVDGVFATTLDSLSAGSYQFGFLSTTPDGTRSLIFTFTLPLTNGTTTTASDIVIPPTLGVGADSVPLGTKLTISGLSVPESAVEVLVDSGVRTVQVTATMGGHYVATVDTQGLAAGVHTLKARTVVGQTASIYSSLAQVGVGVPAPAARARRADVNDDGRVNIVDFSILAYWYKRPLPQGAPFDLNDDGQVSLADFSILAFNWSG